MSLRHCLHLPSHVDAMAPSVECASLSALAGAAAASASSSSRVSFGRRGKKSALTPTIVPASSTKAQRTLDVRFGSVVGESKSRGQLWMRASRNERNDRRVRLNGGGLTAFLSV
ncbi:hypothetical protein PINS_up014620 [Pythium insidiosum]|nr:hypothetical protein PINS_up014620 [Pythium insidiosum]